MAGSREYEHLAARMPYLELSPGTVSCPCSRKREREAKVAQLCPGSRSSAAPILERAELIRSQKAKAFLDTSDRTSIQEQWRGSEEDEQAAGSSSPANGAGVRTRQGGWRGRAGE